MSSLPIWAASGISTIGMLFLVLFSTPLQVLPVQKNLRQHLVQTEGSLFFQTASSAPAMHALPQLNRGQNPTPLAVITITLQAQPASQQDFRFHGDLGDFSLDQAGLDDGDTITQTITFSVTPGVYTVTAEVPLTWHLRQLDCTPADQTQVTLLTGQATLTLHEGDQMYCTFVNERGVTIRTRSYHDANGSRTYWLGELYTSGWEMTVYKDQNLIMGVQPTNQYGKANFNYLPTGEYAACETVSQGWENSQPGLVDPTYGGPCYVFTLQSGEIATLWFGNQRTGDPGPLTQPTLPRAIAIVQGADVASDDSGYADWEFVDTDMYQDDRPPSAFLPLAFTRYTHEQHRK